MTYEKFIIIRDDKVLVGQNASSGIWYCKELPSPKECLKKDMNTVIKILNFYNHNTKEKNDKELKKKGEK